ncbi:hypothetical protein OG548_27665 [Streptomyces sp. NBC_01356]|uniref:hypothetical protein n=1 Tax=Streptomyces sp. NBC_01356 TaxID=2903836 RepID=UPI002E337E7A|nr:hypothetical protein [Streptomyces sp. NBC_01356]
MTGSVQRPLLFLDVDGPLIPFGGAPQYPDGYPTYGTTDPEPPGADPDPLLPGGPQGGELVRPGRDDLCKTAPRGAR